MNKRSEAALTDCHLPFTDAPSESPLRFAVGGQFRFEVPSTEGPRAFQRVLEEARRLECPIHRVSQGSGIQMLSDGEIREMARIGADRAIEVCLFVTPRANFDVGGLSGAPAGKYVQWQVRGARQLRYALDDVFRACDLGIRSVLISDYGLLRVLGQLRRAGKLPPSLVLKSSAILAPSNPATFALLEELGADTLNTATDLTLEQLASVRLATTKPLDIYLEAPDGLGGFVRHHEAPEIVRATSPCYLKLGLRNSPDVYPSGEHLHSLVLQLSAERVRRTRLVYDLLRREAPDLSMAPEGTAASEPGIPLP